MSLDSSLGFSLHEEQFSDPIQQAAAQSAIELEYYQVEAGQYSGNLSQFNCADILLCNEFHGLGLYKRGVIRSGLCTISFFKESRVKGWCQGMKFAQSRSPLFFMPNNVELDIHVEADADLCYLALDQNELMARAASLNPDWPGDIVKEFSVLSENSLVVQQAVHELQALSTCGHTVDWAAVSQSLWDILALSTTGYDRCQPDRAACAGRKHRILKTARSYMEGCMEGQVLPGLADVCGVAGVSHRTLQYCFQDLLNVSPITFLRILRLNRVRAELRQAPRDATVTAIATRYGFLHLGKFSLDYRQYFGESPSTTLVSGRT